MFILRKVLRGTKYHCRHFLANFSKMANMRSNISVRSFGIISNIILMVGLSLGLYTRWHYNHDIVVLVISILALFIFAISCALVYYFSMESVGTGLARLWIGALIGVLTFTESKQFQFVTTEEVMNILLMSSVGVRCFWNILERCMHLVKDDAAIISSLEALEMTGMCIASLATRKQFVPITLLILAFALTIMTIRLKSLLAVLNLAWLLIVAIFFFFPRLHITVNPFSLTCFAGRLAFEPIIDIYFSGLTTLERWQPFLGKSRLIRRLTVLAVVALEIAYLVLLAKQIPQHKEWYIVVPIFAVFSVVWLCYHFVFIITCWQLMNKITDCNATYRSLSRENRSMNRIMASKGVRHFGLISQRLVLVTFVTTLILAAIGWTTRSGVSLSVMLMVMPVESMVLSLLYELGSTLGGTIIGYALVAPPAAQRVDGSATLLPASALQELSTRSTHLLNLVQRFFNFHLIENYGCDYSSSGLSPESVCNKLKSFFQRHTADGPKFDTYIVYYSGHVQDNGDWALAGFENLKLETILEWWREMNEEIGARLIVVVDAEHSHQWVRDIRRVSDQYVAIQTCKMKKNADPEEGPGVNIGDFTVDWTAYNCGEDIAVSWSEKMRPVKAMYGTSKCWTDFTFHLPTEQDISQHWESNFPRVIKPLIKVTNFPQIGSLFCCCDCFIRCLKRKKMKWLPPLEYDTGHGFKLVQS